MAGWARLSELVRSEVKQREEEGYNVEGFREKAEEAGEDRGKLMQVYEQLEKLQPAADFPYVEPSDLGQIRSERPEGPRRLTVGHSEAVMRDKFLGAWLGRAAGCALGKPLEYFPFAVGSNGRKGYENIKLWFEGADAWPINNYVPDHSRAEKEYGLEIGRYAQKSVKEHIQFMETDDDIRYTVFGLMLLEQYGLDFDTWDVGKMWHQKLTYGQVCTAETQAYLNFAQATWNFNAPKPEDWPERIEWVRTYLNPYREWIGAQIRADGLAYGVAGNPELAAELGWRDASLSHVKNGIYGEMFVAAMIAAAFVETDMQRVVEIGLSEIPRRSRLAEDIRNAVEIGRNAKTQEELISGLWSLFDERQLSPVHTNNNAALVAAALIFADSDYERAITTAVYGGWDTDCNGATVGSIMGAALGADKLPQHWVAPLNDKLYSEIIDFHPIAISECARRSYEVWRKLQAKQ